MVRTILSYIKEEWLTAIAFFVLAIAMFVTTNSLVETRVSVDSPDGRAAIVFIELIALLLPAFAIVLQAAVSYSRKSVSALYGEATKFRYAAFGIVGTAFILLTWSMIILVEYLALSDPLIAVGTMLFTSIFLIGSLLASIGIYGLTGDVMKAEQIYDITKASVPFGEFEQFSEELQDEVGDIIDEVVEEDEVEET